MFGSLFALVLPAFLSVQYSTQAGCIDGVWLATGFTSSVCAAQGFIFLFGALSVLFWLMWFSVHIYLAVVYHSKWIIDKNKWIQAVTWITSAVLAITAYFVGAYSFIGVGPCFVNATWVDYFFLLPGGISLGVTIICFLMTLVYISKHVYKMKKSSMKSSSYASTTGSAPASSTKQSSKINDGLNSVKSDTESPALQTQSKKVYVDDENESGDVMMKNGNAQSKGESASKSSCSPQQKEKKRKRRVLMKAALESFKLQYRSLVIIAAYTVTFVIFFTSYRFIINQLKDITKATPWVAEWAVCIFAESGTIDTCSTISQRNLPSAHLLFWSFILPALLPVWWLLGFGLRRYIFKAWAEW
jgi:hypothetical protein